MAFLPDLTDFDLEMSKIGHLDQFYDQITWGLFWLFSPTLQAVRGIFCRNLTGFFSDFFGGAIRFGFCFWAPKVKLSDPKSVQFLSNGDSAPLHRPKNWGQDGLLRAKNWEQFLVILISPTHPLTRKMPRKSSEKFFLPFPRWRRCLVLFYQKRADDDDRITDYPGAKKMMRKLCSRHPRVSHSIARKI